MTPETLGVRIRALREAKSLSLGKLSVRAGIDKSTLARIEGGLSSCRATTLAAIATALDVELAELIAGGGKRRAKASKSR